MPTSGVDDRGNERVTPSAPSLRQSWHWPDGATHCLGMVDSLQGVLVRSVLTWITKMDRVRREALTGDAKRLNILMC